MTSSLTNLDEIEHDIRNNYSRDCLKEAILAYRAGAHRAAIIMSWIAVCVDIIEKIKELSIVNDGTAKELEERLNKINPNDYNSMLSFEKEILEIACEKLEFISVIEKKHLERLKDDRNICSHPTFSQDGQQFIPSPELTRTYIVQVAQYLLIHGPTVGRTILTTLNKLIEQESYPEESDKVFELLSSVHYLQRAKDSTVRNFIVILLKSLINEPSLTLSKVNKLCATINATSRLNYKMYSDVMKDKLSKLLSEIEDHRLKRVFFLQRHASDSWEYIDEAIKGRLVGLINNLTAQDILLYNLMKIALTNRRIDEAIVKRVDDLTVEDRLTIITDHQSARSKDLAIDVFIKSRSFDGAYSNGKKYLVPHSEFYTEQDLQRILNGALENNPYRSGPNQILYAGGISEIFIDLYERTKKLVPNNQVCWKSFIRAIDEGDLVWRENLKDFRTLLVAEGVLFI